jgi:hypothetical protein
MQRQLPNEAQIAPGGLRGDVGKVHRVPVRIEELVRRVRHALFEHRREDVFAEGFAMKYSAFASHNSFAAAKAW